MASLFYGAISKPGLRRYAILFRTPFLLPDAMPTEIQIRREIDIERLRMRLRRMRVDVQQMVSGKSCDVIHGNPPN